MDQKAIQFRCPQCSHEWARSEDQLRSERVILRGDKETAEEIRVRCPQCGQLVIKTVQRGNDG